MVVSVVPNTEIVVGILHNILWSVLRNVLNDNHHTIFPMNLSLFIKYLFVFFIIISAMTLLSCNSSQITNGEIVDEAVISNSVETLENNTSTDDLAKWRKNCNDGC